MCAHLLPSSSLPRSFSCRAQEHAATVLSGLASLGDNALAIKNAKGIEILSSSEDTWIEGATSGLDAVAQLEQSLLRSEDDTAWAQMLLKGVHQAAAAVGAAVAQLGEHNTSRTLSFSPFYSSCIAIRRSRTLANLAGEVTVELETRLIGPMAMSSGSRSVGEDAVDPWLWRGPVVLLLAVVASFGCGF